MDSPVSSWLEAAEKAERMLELAIEQDEEAGFDEYGWADDDVTLSPEPLDPTSDLRELVSNIEAVAGPIGEHPPPSVISTTVQSPTQDNLCNFVK